MYILHLVLKIIQGQNNGNVKHYAAETTYALSVQYYNYINQLHYVVVLRCVTGCEIPVTK